LEHTPTLEATMPDKTDISLDSADGVNERLDGPDEDDAEAMYDPDNIEVSRARELGLGMGAIDLARQNDVTEGASFADGDVERMSSDELTAADDISGSDANALDIDEDFDTEDNGPDAERLDDRATSRPR
jgi:hypothetical protein